METPEERLSRLERYIYSWVVEKSRSVLENVVELHEEFLKRHDLPEEFAEAYRFHLGPVLYNSTKILAFAASKQWAWEDAYSIGEQGRSGLEKVLVKYGLLREDETAEAQRIARTQSLLGDLEELRELLSGPSCPCRTRIHELLPQLRGQDPVVVQIEDLTELVTMGGLSWGEYVNSAGKLVDGLLAKYRGIEGQAG